MSYLSKNWLTNGLIDFEYKKYIMLSYLKYVQQHFSDKKLYPMLPELTEHYQNLRRLKEEKMSIENKFPKRVTRLDLERQMIHYRRKVKNSDLLTELETIMEYGLMLFDEQMQIGNDLVEKVKEAITIEPVGISPLYKQEGYLLVSTENSNTVRIYKYTLSRLKGLGEDDEQIKTHFIDVRKRSISNTYEQIKSDMIKLKKDMPIPATYLIYCTSKFPFQETYLPIAKRMLKNRLAA